MHVSLSLSTGSLHLHGSFPSILANADEVSNLCVCKPPLRLDASLGRRNKVLFQTVLCGITEINLLTLWLLVRQIPSFCLARGTVADLGAEEPEVLYAPHYLILQSELMWALDLPKASTEHSHQQTK